MAIPKNRSGGSAANGARLPSRPTQTKPARRDMAPMHERANRLMVRAQKQGRELYGDRSANRDEHRIGVLSKRVNRLDAIRNASWPSARKFTPKHAVGGYESSWDGGRGGHWSGD